MYSVEQLHVELTDKCQAACPMCARNHNGHGVRPFLTNIEITIDNFNTWFPPEFLQTLKVFYASGNYGDPAFATDCLEIYKHVRHCNPDIYTTMHTNGSLRTPEWWAQLAIYNNEVVFAVDGLKGKHELYRRNTNFDKIIANIKAFVNAGGIAKVNSLIFAHNEHDTQELEQFLLGIGVAEVRFIHTRRFHSVENFPVFDNNNKLIYHLQPSSNTTIMLPLERLLDDQTRNRFIANAIIDPKCVSNKEIFVDCRGNLLPCSYLGSDYVEQPLTEITIINTLRNMAVSDTKKHLKNLTVANLHDGDITKLLPGLWSNLGDLWTGNKCLTCVNTCSANNQFVI